MFSFHNNHRKLASTSFIAFLMLSILIAVVPAYQMQETVRPLPDQKDLTAQERRGLKVFVSENCVACHTQQVRNIGMDSVWGKRPSMPSDYYYSKERLSFWQQSPSLLGSERTGPDLTNVGERQPGQSWHLIHFYNPRIVEKKSVMPAYPWLFIEKAHPGKKDVVITVPKEYVSDTSMKIVATQRALDLAAYLQSLKQTKLPSAPAFLPSSNLAVTKGKATIGGLPDGAALYASTCQACHQADGKGLPGAFPPLAGSPIVNNENYDDYVKIILQGYDAREEYGVMPSFADRLTDEEITAIMNHERSSWGNKAKPLKVEDVARVRKFVNSLKP